MNVSEVQHDLNELTLFVESVIKFLVCGPLQSAPEWDLHQSISKCDPHQSVSEFDPPQSVSECNPPQIVFEYDPHQSLFECEPHLSAKDETVIQNDS